MKCFAKDREWSYHIDDQTLNETEVLENWEMKEKEFVRSPFGVVPLYQGGDNYSKDSIRWLEYESEREGL